MLLVKRSQLEASWERWWGSMKGRRKVEMVRELTPGKEPEILPGVNC